MPAAAQPTPEDAAAPKPPAPTAAETAAVEALAAEADRLDKAAAERPAKEEGESTEDYITRLREAQVQHTRTDV